MKVLIDMTALWLLAAFGASVRMDAVTVGDLNEKLLDLNEQAEGIQARADAESRALTADEESEINGIFADFKLVEEDISRRERIAQQSGKLRERMGRQTDPNDVVRDDEEHIRQPKQKFFREPRDNALKGSWGWRSFGDYAAAVKNAAGKGGNLDPRLIQNAPTTFGSEGVGADGGFLIPPDFRTAIMELVTAEDSMLGRTDQLTSQSNTLVLPKDETTNWSSSGGIQAYWEAEAGQLTQSKPALDSNTIRLNKLTALVPVTEELLDDASAIDSYLRRKVPAKFDFKVNNAIVNGTGAGMPRGILNAGSLVTVAKESGQAADTVVFENIVNMWTRMYAQSRRNAVWLINQDIEGQLMTMGFPTAATAVPVYLPPGGLSATPYGTLLGRPVLPTQACQTLGDAGDIILADLNSYLTAVKTGGVRTDVSIHLWFDYDVLAYRFIMRIAGQPWLNAAISPLNGTNTVSPFVTLAERA